MTTPTPPQGSSEFREILAILLTMAGLYFSLVGIGFPGFREINIEALGFGTLLFLIAAYL